MSTDLAPNVKKQLRNAYVSCRDAHKNTLDEVGRFRELFENYSKGTSNRAKTNILRNDEMFRSALLYTSVTLRAAIMSDGQPRFYTNPILKQNKLEELKKKIEEANDPIINDLVAERGIAGFIDYVFDAKLDDYFKNSGIKSLMFSAIRSALCAPKVWFKMREEGKTIVNEVIPYEYVCEDTLANTRYDRKYIFHFDQKTVPDIELIYGLPPHSLCEKLGYVEQSHSGSGYSSGTTVINTQITSYEQDYFEKKKYVDIVEAYIRGNVWDYWTGSKKSKDKIVTFLDNVYVKNKNGYVTDNEGNPVKGVYILEIADCKRSDFPIFDFIPDAVSETRGRPIARDLECYNAIDDMVMQTVVYNYRLNGKQKVYGNPSMLDKFDHLPDVEFVPVDSADEYKVTTPQLATTEGLSLSNAVRDKGQYVSGLSDVQSGRHVGRLESAKSYITLNDLANRYIRPSIREYEFFLTRYGMVFSEVLVQSASKGSYVNIGKKNKVRVVLPFDMKDYVEALDITIEEDSTIPKDKASQANLLMELAGKVNIPIEILLETAGVEDVDRIVNAQKKDQMLQQAVQQLQQMQQMLQQLQEENQKMKFTIEADQIKCDTDLKIQESKNKGNLQRVVVQGQIKSTLIDKENSAKLMDNILKSANETATPDQSNGKSLANKPMNEPVAQMTMPASGEASPMSTQPAPALMEPEESNGRPAATE